MMYHADMDDDVQAYNDAQTADYKAVCELLMEHIELGLPNASRKVWHGHPVWFIDGNPISGYAVLKDSVQLLFWSGQSFDEEGLEPEGTFKAAQVRYKSAEEVDIEDLRRWLKKAETIQWDYKNIVKRRGRLERL